MKDKVIGIVQEILFYIVAMSLCATVLFFTEVAPRQPRVDDVSDLSQDMFTEEDQTTGSDDQILETPSESADGEETVAPAPVARELVALTHDQVKANPFSGYAALTAEGQEAYDRLYAAAASGAEEADLTDLSLSQECAGEILLAVEEDCPELFDLYYTSHRVNSYGLLEAFLLVHREGWDQKAQELSQWAANIVSQVPQDQRGSEAEVALWLHDYLVDTTEYLDDAPDNQSVLSVSEAGQTVCAGYAHAYSLLLHQAGIFSGYITGMAPGGHHAWNLVLLDGELGYVDVTWDDSEDPSERYHYFGLSAETMILEEGHNPDSVRGDFNTAPGCAGARALLGLDG